MLGKQTSEKTFSNFDTSASLVDGTKYVGCQLNVHIKNPVESMLE